MKKNNKLIAVFFTSVILISTTACNFDPKRYSNPTLIPIRTEEEIVEDLNTRYPEYKPFEAVSSDNSYKSTDNLSYGDQIEVHLESEKLPEKDIIVRDRSWISQTLFGTTSHNSYTSNIYYLLYIDDLIAFYENYYSDILKNRDYKIICHYDPFRSIKSGDECKSFYQFCATRYVTDQSYIVISGDYDEDLDKQLRNKINELFKYDLEDLKYLYIGNDNLDDVNSYRDIQKYKIYY